MIAYLLIDRAKASGMIAHFPTDRALGTSCIRNSREIDHHRSSLLLISKMAVRTVGNGDDTQVFMNDSNETSEVTSACCHKFKIELRSALKKWNWVLVFMNLRWNIWLT
jgi:23S rRNA C2498 (ribose-2'-O)-methylase RlmM